MFSGSIVALVTPFRNNFVDFAALEKLISFHIKSKTDGILVCGSTGEGLLLTMEERAEIIKKSTEFAKGKVIVGCSACSTKEAIDLVNQAEDLKADGVLVIAPYYVKPTQNGIKEHFETISRNSNIPMIAYNNPGRCSVNMSIETISELSHIKNIKGLKDSDTNLSRVTLLRKAVDPDFALLSGDDPSVVGYLAHGGDGAISVAANVVPHLVKRLTDAWKNGDIAKVQEINAKIMELNLALFVEPNPIPVKYALYKMGLIENELRLPLTKASEKTMTKLDVVLSQIDCHKVS